MFVIFFFMFEAYVGIRTLLGYEEKVLEQLKKIDGVKSAVAVYGVYNVFVQIAANTKEDLDEIVTLYIQKIDGVTSKSTMIVKS